MKRRAVFLVAALPFLASPLLAISPDDLAPCTPSSNTTRKDFRIDARTVDTDDPRRYQLDDEVRIVVLNKNPFIYEYQLVIEETPVAEPGLASALQIFAFADAIVPALPPPPAAAPPPPAARAPIAGDPCQTEREAARSLATTLDEQQAAFEKEFEELRATYTSIGTRYKSLVDTVEPLQRRLGSVSTSCQDLRTAAASFINEVDKFGGTEPLDALVEKLQALTIRLGAQEILITDYEKRFSPACRPIDQIRNWRGRVALVRAALPTISGKLEEIKKGVISLKTQRADVERAAGAPDAFFTHRPVGPFDLPTDVAVRLNGKRKGVADAKFGELGKWALNFGGRARFAVSAGIAFSSLNDRTFKVSQGFPKARPDDPPPTTGTISPIVDLDKDSDWRATPLVLLHTRLRELPGGVDLHASFGVSAKVQDNNTHGEYLGGVSFSFAEERVFLTLGGYYGRVQELGGNLFPGAALPADTTTVPVRQESRWEPGISLTYKIR